MGRRCFALRCRGWLSLDAARRVRCGTAHAQPSCSCLPCRPGRAPEQSGWKSPCSSIAASCSNVRPDPLVFWYLSQLPHYSRNARRMRWQTWPYRYPGRTHSRSALPEPSQLLHCTVTSSRRAPIIERLPAWCMLQPRGCCLTLRLAMTYFTAAGVRVSSTAQILHPGRYGPLAPRRWTPGIDSCDHFDPHGVSAAQRFSSRTPQCRHSIRPQEPERG